MKIASFVSILLAVGFVYMVLRGVWGSPFAIIFAGFGLLLIVQQIRWFITYISNRPLEFSAEFLEPGEKILFSLDNVWTRRKANRLSLSFSIAIRKTHLVITNRRIISALLYWGKPVYKKKYGNTLYKSIEGSSYGWDTTIVGSVDLVEEDFPKLVIKSKSSQLKVTEEIFTRRAGEIYGKVKGFVEELKT